MARRGGSGLTRREVIDRIQSIAPEAWLRSHKLDKPLKSLLKKFNVQRTIAAYELCLQAAAATDAADATDVAMDAADATDADAADVDAADVAADAADAADVTDAAAAAAAAAAAVEAEIDPLYLLLQRVRDLVKQDKCLAHLSDDEVVSMVEAELDAVLSIDAVPAKANVRPHLRHSPPWPD